MRPIEAPHSPPGPGQGRPERCGGEKKIRDTAPAVRRLAWPTPKPPHAPAAGALLIRPFPEYFRDMSDTYRDGKAGWGGRDRTCECRYQKPVPYHLATPHPWRLRQRRDHACKPSPFASLHLIGPRSADGDAAARRERCCSCEILCSALYLYCIALYVCYSVLEIIDKTGKTTMMHRTNK